jgi:Asp-tRNA(Asn)/Glu-tRNA(Gln) amidotransferase A subunit family amidase
MANSTKSSPSPKTNNSLPRRRFLAYFSGLGLSSTLLPGILWAKIEQEKNKKITKEMLADAERLAGLEFTEPERDLMIQGLNRQLQNYEKIRNIPLDNSVSPALKFHPTTPDMKFDQKQLPLKFSQPPKHRLPADLEDIAFWPVTDLAQLIKSRNITSTQLTRMYLDRLKRYDEKLKCVVTLTEELALKQARRADEEISAGKYRGPLHGIPWGAKDLFAVKGYKTTWGAMPYKDQIIDMNATVVRRLEQAGAVLVAKLTLGALAMGEYWYGGMTRNPWNIETGSSGSSAGPAAATAAGLVGFSLGTETCGSIVSPCTICGVTGLRPTFGRVSRHGAMALSWSMDKIGPICRSVEDCALVFNAIYGPDSHDDTIIDLPFNYDASRAIKDLKIGYIKSAFELDRQDKKAKANDLATLDALRDLGVDLIPKELPDYPALAMLLILNCEAAAAFDELTRNHQDDLLTRQTKDSWPNIFRKAQMVSAVSYIQANRARSLMIKAMREFFSDLDVYICPSWGGSNLYLTNLTGHPAVVLPNGFNDKSTPSGITFMADLYAEQNALTVAHACQNATDFHLQHPKL